MKDEENLIERRKNEHIHIVVQKPTSSAISSYFEYVQLIHRALPQVDFSEIDLSTSFLGKKIDAPIMIAGMTGGTKLAKKLNKIIAQAAETLNIPMGVGSQRAGLKQLDIRETYSVVREVAPNIPIIANIGVSQLKEAESLEELAKNLIEMVDADAIALHLNPLQEVVQPEGEPHYKDILPLIEEFVKKSPKPVILKETGNGLSKEDASIGYKCGIRIFDTGGAGGTSFALVESYRAEENGEEILSRTGLTFAEWGIPTAASILEVLSACFDCTVIATGGIRSGLDAGKALRLGARIVGIAAPIITAAYSGGYKAVEELLRTYIRELRTVLFVTNADCLEKFKRTPAFIFGKLNIWVKNRELTAIVEKLGIKTR